MSVLVQWAALGQTKADTTLSPRSGIIESTRWMAKVSKLSAESLAKPMKMQVWYAVQIKMTKGISNENTRSIGHT
eukprot:5274595-Pyramimonas_sp.AAC.1